MIVEKYSSNEKLKSAKALSYAWERVGIIINEYYEEWVELSEKVVFTIRLHLMAEVIFNVKKEITTASLWKRLGEPVPDEIPLKSDIFEVSIMTMETKEGTKVSERLNTFNNIIS